jgi:uncharacterized protein YecE (DUF72 family)
VEFDRERLAQMAAELAAKGAYIGTSSWKYEGWCGMLYNPAHYEFRGKFAKSRFEKDCLREYAEVFKTVCVDAAFYKFPDHKFLDPMMSQVPDDFRFGFKVTDTITVKKFPNLPRFGMKAGEVNADFLNAELFADAFLAPCELYHDKVGLLMFEFGKFHKTDFAAGREFVETMDTFLGKLPKGWPYGVEIRNSNWLTPEYFSMLSKHSVAHIYNSWTHMPPVSEQLKMPCSLTNPQLTGARFLLTPGRTYEQAVKSFQPYNETKQTDEDARRSAIELLVRSGRYHPRTNTYTYINNRLEGNALQTIAAVTKRAIELLDALIADKKQQALL